MLAVTHIDARDAMFASRLLPGFWTKKEMGNACRGGIVVMLAQAIEAILSSHANIAYPYTILCFLFTLCLIHECIGMRSLLPHPTNMVSLSVARP